MAKNRWDRAVRHRIARWERSASEARRIGRSAARTAPNLTILLAGTCLSGCLGISDESLLYDPAVKNTAAAITLSDPKLYSRETLINERAADAAWIERKITESEDAAKISFKPALYREMEEISAFSAALGLRYDPAEALSYKRSNETGEVQQQIDVLKLQLQLEQLRRDAELMRQKLPDQTEPANSGLGTLGTGAAVTAGAAVTPADVSQLTTAVNTLMTGLAGRLDAEAKPPGKTDVVSSPADDFRDRLAYRDMLKAARNAAGLDELHDTGNNRLIRLNFQATVFPDPENPRALGAVQMVVQNKANGSVDSFFADWLRNLNTIRDWRIDAGHMRSSATLDALEATRDFRRVTFGSLEMVMPILVTEQNAALDPQDLIDRAEWDKAERADFDSFALLLAGLSVDAKAKPAKQAAICQNGSPYKFALDIAAARTASYELVQGAELVALDLGSPSPAVATREKYRRAAGFQQQVLEFVVGRAECSGIIADYRWQPSTWRLMGRSEFAGAGKVRIYEVGPREQAQQVSTLARSANSLALAASIAASAPESGAAANLGAGFRRDVMTKASALDRVPEVVGYSVAGQGTFGWVIGPRATATPKGRVAMEQLLRPYDLSVDLSVPSWWRSLRLKVVKAWAPSPRLLATGNLATAPDASAKGQGNDAKDFVDVPMPAAMADYRAFTQFLIKDSKRPVDIEAVVGGPVNGCAETRLLLKGPNLWRADKVLLLGTVIGRDKFVIAPDMAGIVVTVPALSAIPGERAYKTDNKVYVLTPLGVAEHMFDYDPTLSGDSCKAKDAADPNAAKIAKVEPASFVVPSKITMEISGANLSKVDAVKLDGRGGTITDKATDGTSLTIEFSKDMSDGLEPGLVKLEFFASKKSVATFQPVRIVRN